MSRETRDWLSSNVLVGFTAKRGNAWHFRQGDNNHYDGAIPLEDVRRRLFDWEPLESPVFIEIPTGVVTDDGEELMNKVQIPGKKAIVPSDDPSHVFGIFSESYQAHSFDDWLVGNVADILDADLQISSAGLLKGRAVAWTEISVPDTISTPQGIDFRPNLLATTSLDGTVATTYKRTVTMTVCDNTRDIAMAEKGQTFKVKHSKYSNLKMQEARDNLQIIHDTADAMSAELKALCESPVTDIQFRTIINAATEPAPKDKQSKMSETLADKKRMELLALWRNDNRVAPWAGTEFGVVQAFDTWSQHIKPTRGETERAERNMLSVINGNTSKDIENTRTLMRKILSNA